MGSCQNDGPFLVTPKKRSCRIRTENPKRDPNFENHSHVGGPDSGVRALG